MLKQSGVANLFDSIKNKGEGVGRSNFTRSK